MKPDNYTSIGFSQLIRENEGWKSHPLYEVTESDHELVEKFSHKVLIAIAKSLDILPPDKPKPQPEPEKVNHLMIALKELIPDSVNEEEIGRLIDLKLESIKPVNHIISVPTKEDVDLGDEHLHQRFEKVLQLTQQGLYPMLVGAAGTGKTHMAEQIARALDRPFASISVTAGMSESQLAGWLIPIEEGGKFTYVPSQFVKMYEEGGVFLVDEMDAGDANTFVFLNQALANGGFFIPQRYENPYVKKHPDFIMIGCANTFGQGADPMYTARERLDASTLDRFEVVDIDYDESFEEKIAEKEIFEWGCSIRKSIDRHEIRRVFSTRKMIAYTKLLLSGWGMSEIKDTYFKSWSEDEIALTA